jgi:hypothetical protein
MYRVTYRVGERSEGILIVEDHELSQALKPAGHDPDSEWEICAEPIGRAEASAIPKNFIGHLLDEDEAAELNRIMVAHIPKKPPAPSVRRPKRRLRSA